MLTNALAIQSIYLQLAPNLGQTQLNALVDASGATTNQTLEDALDALRVLLDPNLLPATATPFTPTSTPMNKAQLS